VLCRAIDGQYEKRREIKFPSLANHEACAI